MALFGVLLFKQTCRNARVVREFICKLKWTKSQFEFFILNQKYNFNQILQKRNRENVINVRSNLNAKYVCVGAVCLSA